MLPKFATKVVAPNPKPYDAVLTSVNLMCNASICHIGGGLKFHMRVAYHFGTGKYYGIPKLFIFENKEILYITMSCMVYYRLA